MKKTLNTAILNEFRPFFFGKNLGEKMTNKKPLIGRDQGGSLFSNLFFNMLSDRRFRRDSPFSASV